MVENYEPAVENPDPQFSVGSGTPETSVPERPPVPSDAWAYPGAAGPEPTPTATPEVPTAEEPAPPTPPTEEQAQ